MIHPPTQKKKVHLLLFLFFRRVLREARFRPPLRDAPRRYCGSCCGLMGCASEKAGADCCAKGLTSEVGKVVGKTADFLRESEKRGIKNRGMQIGPVS